MAKPAAAAGGSTFTLNPSAQSGWVSSNSVADYASARTGSGLTAHAGDSTLQLGQVQSPPNTYDPASWSCMEVFLDFNLASVTGTVVSATLSIGLASDASTTDFTIEARTRDWGATLTTADWVAGASLGGLTLLASLSTAGIGAAGYKALTESGSALRSAVTAAGTGTLRVILASDRLRLGTDPAGSGDGSEYVVVWGHDSATLKAKLVVVTS